MVRRQSEPEISVEQVNKSEPEPIGKRSLSMETAFIFLYPESNLILDRGWLVQVIVVLMRRERRAADEQHRDRDPYAYATGSGTGSNAPEGGEGALPTDEVMRRTVRTGCCGSRG